MRIYAVSDLHTDFAENRRRLQRISSTSYSRDVLVVAGDIADDLRTIGWTLRKFRSQFGQVFYVPGNHELWVRDGEYDSVEKFRQVLRLCDDVGIHTLPGKAGNAWVVPLFSWYESDYDRQGRRTFHHWRDGPIFISANGRSRWDPSQNTFSASMNRALRNMTAL